MSEVMVSAWHCDRCGYEWLKTKRFPKQCPNRSCRSRAWDSNFPTNVRERPVVKVDTLPIPLSSTAERIAEFNEANNLMDQSLLELAMGRTPSLTKKHSIPKPKNNPHCPKDASHVGFIRGDGFWCAQCGRLYQ